MSDLPVPQRLLPIPPPPACVPVEGLTTASGGAVMVPNPDAVLDYLSTEQMACFYVGLAVIWVAALQVAVGLAQGLREVVADWRGGLEPAAWRDHVEPPFWLCGAVKVLIYNAISLVRRRPEPFRY